ncbi:unnamed protein product [Caenorhabditis angaria]|uniref:Tyrosine-protein kinase n=1 Tax=Caenorhabditis angaria TaxID=860376 RepID=A0A9P1I4D5_9PELO|nr:unnamed protein product [Caenorhabditis angaria]
MAAKQPEKQEKDWLAEKSNVKKLKFYHGVITREDVQILMKESHTGDFLLRAALMKTDVILRVFLCVKIGDQEIHHYLLEFCKDEKFFVKQEFEKEGKGKITVDSQIFKDFDEMIAHFRHHRLACGVRLKSSIPRPRWQMNRQKIIYDETGILGEGNFCFVYHGKLRRKDGKDEEIAIKISKSKGDAVEDSAAIMAARNALFAEARIMTTINYPHIIKLFGICCDSPPFMVIMEFCKGGSVENLLEKSGREMEEYERQTILIDACRGMRYLHEKKCVHRDLAARNCLISSDGLIKIADFGLSRPLAANQTSFKETLKQAPLVWLAPECIQKQSEFSSKSDVWAFGVLTYEVYFDAQKPFAEEKDNGVIIKNIRKANMPMLETKTSSPKMDEMLAAIWTKKPEDRIDSQKCLEFLVDALVAGNMTSVKKMQLNKLTGVSRKKMANTDTDRDREDTEYAIDAITPSFNETKSKFDRKKAATVKRRNRNTVKKKSSQDNTVPKSGNKESE